MRRLVAEGKVTTQDDRAETDAAEEDAADDEVQP